MLQFNIPKLEEDILASNIRRHANLFEELIQDLRVNEVTPQDAMTRIRQIERGLRRLTLPI